MTSERAAYVALALTPGIGIARIRTLLAACSTAHGVLSAPFEFLCSIPGISGAAATAIRSQQIAAGENALAEAARLGAEVLMPEDPRFPSLLTQIPDAPPLLFAQGNLELLASPAAAVVGSRDHTAYGAEICRLVAGGAAGRGIVVVSGMARGLDALAHYAALEAGGGTIGVLGNGIGVVYPAANRALYERVTRDGLLLSEFPPGERPHAGSFPRRNRLISGLARVSVIIEAAVGSGALITAGTALDQGRDVMAVPGPITSPVSAGSNALIRDGAEPLLCLDDLVRHYPEAAAASVRQAPGKQLRRDPLPPDLSAELRSIAESLGDSALPLDDIVSMASRPVSEVLGSLCELELLGIVEQRAGRMFSLSDPDSVSHRERAR